MSDATTVGVWGVASIDTAFCDALNIKYLKEG